MPATDATDGAVAVRVESATPRTSTASGGADGLLIIVNDAFREALTPSLDRKQKTGWKVVTKRT